MKRVSTNLQKKLIIARKPYILKEGKANRRHFLSRSDAM